MFDSPPRNAVAHGTAATSGSVKLSWRYVLLVPLAILTVATLVEPSNTGTSISYSPTLDSICSIARGPHIEDEWKAELESRLEEYRSLWRGVGPRLLAEAERLTGLSRPSGARVRLTLCDVPSQSLFGISVNMRFALRSYADTPVPFRYKVDTQFHELLHHMLHGHIPETSHLLALHSGEPECVRDHLHLLALQKAVLLRSGDQAALADVIRYDSSLPRDCYKRAWELVNTSQTEYLSYVSEIIRQ